MAIFRFEIESDDTNEMRTLMGALFGFTGDTIAAATMPEVKETAPKATRAKSATKAKEVEPADGDPIAPVAEAKPEEVVSKPTEQSAAASAAASTAAQVTEPSDVDLDQVKRKGQELFPHIGGATGVIAFLKETTKRLTGTEIGGYGSLPAALYGPVYQAMEEKLSELTLGA